MCVIAAAGLHTVLEHEDLFTLFIIGVDDEDSKKSGVLNLLNTKSFRVESTIGHCTEREDNSGSSLLYVPV